MEPFSEAEREDLELTLELTLPMVSEEARERYYAAADAARQVLTDPTASETQLRAGLRLLADGFDTLHRELVDQGLAWPKSDPE